jgi:phage FluMu gp28-like protein
MRLTLADALADGLFKRICLRTGQEWSPEAEAKWEASLRKRYGDAAEEELDVIPCAAAACTFRGLSSGRQCPPTFR